MAVTVGVTVVVAVIELNDCVLVCVSSSRFEAVSSPVATYIVGVVVFVCTTVEAFVVNVTTYENQRHPRIFRGKGSEKHL